MSKCRDLEPLVGPYADGDVAAADRAAVDAHLDRCPPCRERVAEQRAVRAVIAARRPALQAAASDRLRARCAAQARAPRRSLAFMAARRWVPLSLAATLLLAVAGVFLFGFNDPAEALAAQMTLDHVTCFQFAPERLTHDASESASRDWTAHQGWAIRIPPTSASAHLELLGVRRCHISSGYVAHVLYRWNGEPLSVFVVPHTLRHQYQQQAIVEKFGHEAVMWTAGDRTYVIVARAEPAALQPVVRYVRASAQ